MQDLCRQTGWEFDERASGRLSVALDAGDGAWRAILAPRPAGGLDARVEIPLADDWAEASRRAVGVMLLTVSGIVRLARPAAPDSLEGLSGALGATPTDILRISGATCMAVFDSEDAVRGLTPDMQALSALKDRMIIATAPGAKVDFVSRCFAPRAGIPEDPVTGSAHTTLVPYWSARLGKAELHAVQASARGGELFCANRGDRVAIAGRAAIRNAGTLDLAGASPRAELADA